MFIGHLAAGIFAKSRFLHVPLGVLLFAAQLADFLFPIFLVIGIEDCRIVPGFTATNPLDLFEMRYSHSLVGLVAWSLLLAFVYVRSKGLRSPHKVSDAIVVATVAFSHFPLDVLCHKQDMPLGLGDKWVTQCKATR